MAKRTRLDDTLKLVSALTQGPPDATEQLGRFLSSRHNLVVARAAGVARTLAAKDLVPRLQDNFERFFDNPVKTDPMCHAKLAIAEALDELGAADWRPFLRGIHHVQMEPAYGGPVDTASTLRARCAQGLAHAGYPFLYVELSTLVNDPQPGARRGAIAVLRALGGERAELVLRTRVLAGDTAEDLYGEYFTALLEIAPDRSIDLVAGFVDDCRPVVADEAMLALGESREPRALEALRDRLALTFDRHARNVLILAIGLTRLDEAAELLLNLLDEADPVSAADAAKALDVFGSSEEIMGRKAAILKARGLSRPAAS